MKKEIKKLQRLRDFFKQGINSGEIKEIQKLQDARKKIETEIEKFREHEKEYK
jgi:CCR4-NOT transcriptional regulation complex NOT5 subunit